MKSAVFGWIWLGPGNQIVRWIWRPFVQPMVDWLDEDPTRWAVFQLLLEGLLLMAARAAWRAGARPLALGLLAVALVCLWSLTVPNLLGGN